MGGIGLLIHRWLLTRDAETGRGLGLPASPVSLSDPSYPWILKDLGWFEAQCRAAPNNG